MTQTQFEVVRLERGRKGPQDVVARREDNKIVVFRRGLPGVLVRDDVLQFAAVTGLEDRGNVISASGRFPLEHGGERGPEVLVVVADDYEAARAKLALKAAIHFDLLEEQEAERKEERARQEAEKAAEEARLEAEARLRDDAFYREYHAVAVEPAMEIQNSMSLIVFGKKLDEVSYRTPTAEDLAALAEYMGIPVTGLTYPVSKRMVPEGQDARYCVLADMQS